MDEQSDPGPDIILVEHVVRHNWNGPGLIRGYCWKGIEEAVNRAQNMTPEGVDSIAVRPYNRISKTWADTNEPAWNTPKQRF